MIITIMRTTTTETALQNIIINFIFQLLIEFIEDLINSKKLQS